MRGSPAAASRSWRADAGLRSALIDFTTSATSSRLGNASRKAVMTVVGFLRSITLRWSKLVRNVNRSVSPSSARVAADGSGSGMYGGCSSTGVGPDDL
jgi:hypothetical protein